MITFSGGGRRLALQTALSRATGSLRSATERLSSGLRINKASDDAAGLAIASSLNTDTRVYTTGIRNLNDGLSALSLADSSLEQLSNVSVRIRELAAQAANGSLTFSQRKSLNSEASQLTQEFNRLIATTSFNGRTLLNLSDSSLRLQAGYGLDGGIGFSFGDELARTVGTGQFGTRSTLAVSNNPTGTKIADLDGDGDNDVIYALNAGGGIGVMLNDGSGNFSAQVSYTGTGAGAGGLALADYNGDGILDAAVNNVSTSDLWIAYGAGNGTFGAFANTGIQIGGTRLETGDVNGDGKADIIGTGVSGTSVVYGNGDGTFSGRQVVSTTSLRQFQVIDFNRDGIMDIVGSTNSNSIEFLYGTASGSFNVTSISTTESTQGIGIDDFDGDGRYDLIVSYNNASTHGQVQTYKQEADGSFTVLQTYGTTVNSQQIATGDFNGDGIKDFIATNTTNTTLRLFLGNGDGSFTTSTLTTGAAANHAAVGDLNGDGVSDILARDSATLFSRYNGVATETTTLQRLDINDARNARAVMDIMQSTIDRVTKERAALGAISSRLETATSVLWTQRLNSETAASQIQDADIAEESAKALRYKIQQNVAASILGQANQQGDLIAQLLSGIGGRRRR